MTISLVSLVVLGVEFQAQKKLSRAPFEKVSTYLGTGAKMIPIKNNIIIHVKLKLYMLNGSSHSFKFDQSIFVKRVVGSKFSFVFKCK